MQIRLKAALSEHAKLARRGGVSVLDRNNQKPSTLVNYETVETALEKINATTIQDLYFQCRNIYEDAVTYKKMTSNRDWQIELTTDIHRYDHHALYQAYQNHFDDVRMIHLHRPFSGWINSLASQAFLHPQIKNRIKFFPHMRYNDYALYEEAVAAMPGMDIAFDDMFDTPIETLAQKIAAFLDVPPPSCELRHESYDLYGKITPYEMAFTRFDDKIEFLTPATQNYLSMLAENGKIKKSPYNFLAWIRYLADMIKFRMKAQN